ncbi:MAG: sulfatase-like hydrolase/transferase [Myxococcota bacterium]
MWWWLACTRPEPCPSRADPDLDRPPPGRQVALAPPLAIRDLRAQVAPGTAVRWEVDGAVAPWTGPIVPARALRPDQTWAAIVGGERAEVTIPEPVGGNVLLVVLDDVGIGNVRAYGIDPTAPPTPTLDRLAAEGLTFRHAWSEPVCSPSRAALLTGRHPRRSGVGWIVDTGDDDGFLPLAEVTLPEALSEAWGPAYATSAIGKWHLAGPAAPAWTTHPLDQGFGWFEGPLGNPSYSPGRGYLSWDEDLNGEVAVRTGYLTAETTDDALARLTVMPEPWLLYVAYNAAHSPWIAPPNGPEPVDDSPRGLYDATLVALDAELGRLLDGLEPELRARTTVIVVGDNGPPEQVVLPPFDPRQAKSSVHELGVRVPLLVTGPAVAHPGATTDAWVHLIDIVPTVAELTGVPLGGPDEALALDREERVPLDGRSFLAVLADPSAPGHDRVYTEGFFPNGRDAEWTIDRRALRAGAHKLQRASDGRDELYHLDPGRPLDDGEDLLASGPSRELRELARALSAELDCLEEDLGARPR